MKIKENTPFALPELPKNNLSCLLYVFKGNIQVNDTINLDKKESLIIKDEPISIVANEESELVLFVTDEAAEIFKDGMFSGNKF